MEEIIDSNLRLEAAKYGFQLVSTPEDANVVLAGSAGLLKKKGVAFDSCIPFYSFDVIDQQPKHRKGWFMVNAIGGIKLKVPVQDAETAQAFLNRPILVHSSEEE
jgi:hypothetical protein